MTEGHLTDEEKKQLLRIARDTIAAYAREGVKSDLPGNLPAGLNQSGGAFVSLHCRGELRGCIGTFTGEGPLAETVRAMALAAGWEDPRFPPLQESELQGLEIEISVLSPLHKISDLNEIKVGVHGLYVTKGGRQGVLLPQVAVEQGWDRDQFLSYTCRKAGLAPDAWTRGGLTLEVFTAEIFGEPMKDEG